MPTYVIHYTEHHHATVEAESESAARQAWIDGDLDHDVVESASVTYMHEPNDSCGRPGPDGAPEFYNGHKGRG